MNLIIVLFNYYYQYQHKPLSINDFCIGIYNIQIIVINALNRDGYYRST